MEKTVEKTFGEQLKRARQDAGITQQAAADTFGISLRGYCRWEKGEHVPSYSTLAAIARRFSVSADHLLGLDAEAPSD